jgi:hypothetical protein
MDPVVHHLDQATGQPTKPGMGAHALPREPAASSCLSRPTPREPMQPRTRRPVPHELNDPTWLSHFMVCSVIFDKASAILR